TQKIMSQIKTRPGGEYNPEVIDEDVRNLMATRQFANVRAIRRDDGGKVIVYFLITEYPRTVREIKYNGAKHLKEDELNTLTGLRVGGILNPRANVRACQLLAARYNQDGRPYATVDLLKGGSEADTTVEFAITEGPEVYISDIEFVITSTPPGNAFVSAAVLNTHIHSSALWFGMFGGKYNASEIESDVARLIEYYRSFGFHDLHVSREIRSSADNRHA